MIVLDAEPGAFLPEAITVVIVEVAGVAFAVPSRLVERVTPPLPVTPLPLVPGFVDGLIGLGGAILPGADLWPGMLARRTAQLPAVAVKRPRVSLGRSTRAGLQSGIFFGHAGAIRELTARIGLEAFGRAGAAVVGTGGHASRLRGEALFTAWEPDLVLLGLHVFAKSI